MKKIAVISDLKFLNWHSLKTIIPAIEKAWKELGPRKKTVKIYRMEKLSDLIVNLKQILGSDVVVFLQMSDASAAFMKFLRVNLRFSGRFVVYLHGDPSTGGVFLKNVVNVFTGDDTFIVSCEAESRALKCAFNRASSIVLPFPLASNVSLLSKRPQISKGTDFYYSGRLSAQKNIHSLLVAFKIYNQANSIPSKLLLFGKPDHIGSRTMGVQSKSYYAMLKRLVSDLKLEKKVKWMGFLPEKEIQKITSRISAVFVSPSIHSDENFGVSAFNALMQGRPAVLSAWGGHLDLKKNFPNQVLLSKIHSTDFGPTISIEELASQMKNATECLDRRLNSEIRNSKVYSIQESVSVLEDIVASKKRSTGRLSFSQFGKRVIKQKKLKRFEKFHVFDGYSDPLAQQIFRAYGMDSKLKFKQNKNCRMIMLPWIKMQILGKCELFTINDPIKGRLVKRLSLGHARRTVEVSDFYGCSARVSKQGLRWAFQNGYVIMVK